MPKNIYADALAVLDAVNLSGVVFSFAEAMQQICEEDHREGHGTDWKNCHPVAVLFAEKIYDLTGRGRGFDEAYRTCMERKEVQS